MKKNLAAALSETRIDLAALILRLGLGMLTMHHGYQKITHYHDMKSTFPSFWGLGGTALLIMAISSEFFGSLFIILGLFTRAAAVPLIITMSVALFKIKEGDIFGSGETAALYLLGYITLLLAGPGIISIDSRFPGLKRSI